jgi:hypothetical protein
MEGEVASSLMDWGEGTGHAHLCFCHGLDISTVIFLGEHGTGVWIHVTVLRDGESLRGVWLIRALLPWSNSCSSCKSQLLWDRVITKYLAICSHLSSACATCPSSLCHELNQHASLIRAWAETSTITLLDSWNHGIK